MAKKVSKLKQFARQYDHLWIGDYLYIECPRPQLSMLEAAAWSPKEEDITELVGAIKKVALFQDYGFFYHKDHHKYYVIDHLWLSTLSAWGSEEMKQYMRDVLARMLSKVWDKIKVVKASSKSEFALVVDVVDEKGESLIKKPKTGGSDTGKKESKQLSLLKEEVRNEDFMETYGISRKVYDNMKVDAYLMEVKDSVNILDICKFLYSEAKVKMADIYDALKKRKIVFQPDKAAGGKYRIDLCQDWIDNKLGFQFKYKTTSYPALYRKGVVMIGMVLHDAGIIDKYILPKVD
jgi:hypothetical protein